MVTSKTLNSNMKTIKGIIVKGFAKLDERFAKVDQRFNEVDDRFNKVDEQFNKIDEQFNKVDERFNEVDQRLDKVESCLQSLDKKVDDVKIELKQDIEGLSLDIEDLAGMTAREFKAVRSEIAQRNLLQDA